MVAFLHKADEIYPAGTCNECTISFLTTVMDSLKDGILAADESGRVKMWIAGFGAMWQLSRQDLSGRNLKAVAQMTAKRVETDGSDMFPVLDYFFSKGKPALELSLKNGEIIEIHSRGLCCDPEDGRIWVFRDVTQERWKEKKFDDANRRLSDIIEFLPEPTMVVDENGIIVVWNKAIEEVSGVKKEDIIGKGNYVQTLHSSGDMLLAIINDILDFSKIEADQVELESVPFDLIDLVEGTGRILGSKAHEKGLELAYRVNPQVHRYVLGDPTRLKQILINLLSNAIKFTEKGAVTLNIHPGPDPEDKEMIRIEVRMQVAEKLRRFTLQHRRILSSTPPVIYQNIVARGMIRPWTGYCPNPSNGRT